MFGYLRKRPATVSDVVAEIVFGHDLPTKRADYSQALRLAAESLLLNQIPLSEIEAVGRTLFSGRVPYSTHELAAVIALNFLKDPMRKSDMRNVQLEARYQVSGWARAGQVTKRIADLFEDALDRIFKE